VKRADLVAILARGAGGSKVAAERALTAFLSGIRDGLRNGGTVTISGFGTFVVARRAVRRGRHPRTGKAITIPSARVPRFRPSRALKAAVR
jgi:DNA-binding protein HU-beta